MTLENGNGYTRLWLTPGAILGSVLDLFGVHFFGLGGNGSNVVLGFLDPVGMTSTGLLTHFEEVPAVVKVGFV